MMAWGALWLAVGYRMPQTGMHLAVAVAVVAVVGGRRRWR
jgi:hypothetical protein